MCSLCFWFLTVWSRTRILLEIGVIASAQIVEPAYLAKTRTCNKEFRLRLVVMDFHRVYLDLLKNNLDLHEGHAFWDYR